MEDILYLEEFINGLWYILFYGEKNQMNKEYFLYKIYSWDFYFMDLWKKLKVIWWLAGIEASIYTHILYTTLYKKQRTVSYMEDICPNMDRNSIFGFRTAYHYDFNNKRIIQINVLK